LFVNRLSPGRINPWHYHRERLDVIKFASHVQSAFHLGPSPDGRGTRLEAVQFLPYPREDVFAFFSDAFELETLTPRSLHFSVLTAAPITMREGLLIDYTLRLHGIPMRWQSRITAWEPPFRFTDEQTRGPYRRWHHEHHFEAVEGGTLCRDLVDYIAPGGWLIDRLFVRADVQRIFRYREAKLRELFPAHASPITGMPV
jgi:ligand-binding SRPBCC domain-containing protein